MSHIRHETVVDVTNIPKELLEEGLKIVGMMLEMQGIKVTDYFFNFDSIVKGESKGIKIILGLDAEGKTFDGKFGGIGVGIDHDGKLGFLGTSESYDGSQANQERQKDLQKQVETLIGGACLIAGRMAIAQAEGKTVQIEPDHNTHQLRVVIKEKK